MTQIKSTEKLEKENEKNKNNIENINNIYNKERKELQNNIVIEAYCPLAEWSSKLIQNKIIVDLAKKKIIR